MTPFCQIGVEMGESARCVSDTGQGTVRNSRKMDVNSSGYGWYEPGSGGIRTEIECAQTGSIGWRIGRGITGYYWQGIQVGVSGQGQNGFLDVKHSTGLTFAVR